MKFSVRCCMIHLNWCQYSVFYYKLFLTCFAQLIHTVKYEGRLEDGTVVSKSDGVEFAVKDGYFCPALAKAVKTMKKGEKVLLTVKPQYGFGEQGRPASGDEGAVPPNATLHIDLELVSWKTVTLIGDRKRILKKVLKEGEGYERPNDGAVVRGV